MIPVSDIAASASGMVSPRSSGHSVRIPTTRPTGNQRVMVRVRNTRRAARGERTAVMTRVTPRTLVEVDRVGVGVDGDPLRLGVALSDPAVLQQDLLDLGPHGPELVQGHQGDVVVDPEVVDPLHRPVLLHVQPLLGLGGEVPDVVALEPVEGGEGVLVVDQLALGPRVLLHGGPPDPLLALARAGVLDKSDGLQAAQVVARRARVRAEQGGQGGGGKGPLRRSWVTIRERSGWARTLTASAPRCSSEGLSDEPQVPGPVGGRSGHELHNTCAHYVCTSSVHIQAYSGIAAGQSRYATVPATIWPALRPASTLERLCHPGRSGSGHAARSVDRIAAARHTRDTADES